MIVAMDLNASPIPEEDEDTFEGHVIKGYHHEPEERIETAVDIARREREERKELLKRKRSDDKPVHLSQSPGYDQLFQTKNFKSYDTRRLPPGWLDCPSSGQEIFGMIPSKVPLGESFNDAIAPGKRYSFKQVLHQQRVAGRKLGLVIDLTNTSRYYPVLDLKKEGIKHVKIQCKGRDSVPDNLSVNQFVYEVTQFMLRQKHSKKYILVHCTHGHNRTGYMIIHYLMRAMSMSVTQAIKIFSDARPPGIYKPDYIDALYAFYHESKPEMVICPPTPEWKRSSELDLNREAIPDDDDDGVSGPDLHENHETDTRMTNDDVLGDEIPSDQQDAFRQFCYQILKLGVGARGHTQFPGSHPVSLNRFYISEPVPVTQVYSKRKRPEKLPVTRRGFYNTRGVIISEPVDLEEELQEDPEIKDLQRKSKRARIERFLEEEKLKKMKKGEGSSAMVSQPILSLTSKPHFDSVESFENSFSEPLAIDSGPFSASTEERVISVVPSEPSVPPLFVFTSEFSQRSLVFSPYVQILFSILEVYQNLPPMPFPVSSSINPRILCSVSRLSWLQAIRPNISFVERPNILRITYPAPEPNIVHISSDDEDVVEENTQVAAAVPQHVQNADQNLDFGTLLILQRLSAIERTLEILMVMTAHLG